MTKLGWTILALIVMAGLGFVSMLSFNGPVTPREASPLPHQTGAAGALLVVPVAGMTRGAIRDTWGEARGGGTRAHHGTDIIASAGTPVLAAAPGRVEKLFASALGGTTLYVRSPDRRWMYYYAHLSHYALGLHEGQAVRAGEPIAYVGDTGDAGPGNYHLHFGLARMRPADGWWQGEDVDPYPLLAGKGPGR